MPRGGTINSIKAKGRKMYYGLKRRGFSKEKAARIANSYANGSWGCFFGKCGGRRKRR